METKECTHTAGNGETYIYQAHFNDLGRIIRVDIFDAKHNIIPPSNNPYKLTRAESNEIYNMLTIE